MAGVCLALGRLAGAWRGLAMSWRLTIFGGRAVNCWGKEIDTLAALLGLSVRKDTRAAAFICWAVEGGAPLSGFAMACALRLMQGKAIGVLSWGWLDFKDVCKAHAIPWQSCVVLTTPGQLDRCRVVLVGKDAQRRHDWRDWAAKLPRTREHIERLIIRTAAPDLSIGKLAQICGVSATTARRYVELNQLPFKSRSK